MKKIISLLLTVVMLATMFIIPTNAAEGNAAVFYNGAWIEPESTWFMESYMYYDKSAEYVQRVKDSSSDNFGGFDFTVQMDFKVTDYGTGSDHMTDFTFSNDIGRYHYGYSFTEQAFIVYDLYQSGSDPNAGFYVLARKEYELALNQWNEFTARFYGKTITLYLNGIEMLVCDLAEAYPRVKGAVGSKFMETWDWEMRDHASTVFNLFMFNPVDVDMYTDNWAIYSGDYDFATGTASHSYGPAETGGFEGDFVGFNTNEDVYNLGWCHNNQNWELAPDGGTEKVTYNRGEVVTHEHVWALNEELSSVQSCTTEGYNYYECANGCGLSEKRDRVPALGHLLGMPDSVIIEATETQSGVETRICTRTGCNQIYTTIIPMLGDTITDGALHGYTNGGTGIYNGYIGAGSKPLFVTEGGYTVEMDIMPITHTANKDFASIYAELGGNGHNYVAGYYYDTNQYKLIYNDQVVATSDKVFDDYSWQKWAFVRTETEIKFYVDGELLLSTEVNPDIYVFDEGSTSTIEDSYSFVLRAPAVELLVDNIMLADPDFDFETRVGVVYSHINLDGEQINDGFIYNSAYDQSLLHAISYDTAAGAGYKIEQYGRPFVATTERHQDRGMKIDSNYANGSVGGYAQLNTHNDGEDGTNYMTMFTEADAPSIELSYDFFMYDWCTDPALLGDHSPSIGAHVNGHCKGSDLNPYGNIFAGYDFGRQQVVIGGNDGQIGGAYSDGTYTYTDKQGVEQTVEIADTMYADYAVAMNEWHNMTIAYNFDVSTYIFTASVYMDGELILSRDYDGDYVTIQYFILYSAFNKGYLDNMTCTINGTLYEEDTDFTNAYIDQSETIEFLGVDWSVADGGKPLHVYNEVPFPASCLTDGYTEYVCACGDSSFTLYNLPATGHSYDEGVVTIPPTGSSVGEMTYTCILCGDSYTEEIAQTFSYGDINSDGSITAADSSILNRYLTGAKVTMNTAAADVNGDGSIIASDASMLNRYLVGAKVVFGGSAS